MDKNELKALVRSEIQRVLDRVRTVNGELHDDPGLLYSQAYDLSLSILALAGADEHTSGSISLALAQEVAHG